MDGSIVFVYNGQTTNATYNAFAKDIDMTITFNDNPKISTAEGKYTLVATVNFGGQTETEEELVEAISDPSENPNWVLNGNNITLSNESTLPQNLIVDSYDGKKLKLKAQVNETETENGLTITLTSELYFVLEK